MLKRIMDDKNIEQADQLFDNEPAERQNADCHTITKDKNLEQFKENERSDSLGSKQEDPNKNFVTKNHRSSSSGFFKEPILIDISIATNQKNIDFKKIDARIIMQEQVPDCFPSIYVISFPEACSEEIIEKLENQTGILCINDNMTVQGRAWYKEECLDDLFKGLSL